MAWGKGKLLAQLMPHGDGSDAAVTDIVPGKLDTIIGLPSWQGGVDPETQICLDKMLYYNLKAGNAVAVKKALGSIISDNRNNIIEGAIESGAKWVLIIDTDMVFPPHALQRMQSHNKPIVSALAFVKTFPYVPNMYKRVSPIAWSPVTEWRDGGLMQMDCVGGAFMLMRTDVVAKLPRPWFADPPMLQHILWEELEKLFTTRDDVDVIVEDARKIYRKWASQCQTIIGEDYFFSELLRRHKIPIHVDTGMKIGHMGRYMFGYNDFEAAESTGAFDAQRKVFHDK